MKIILTTYLLALISVFGIAQNWQAHSLVSQYWPNNDVKSYFASLRKGYNKFLQNIIFTASCRK